MVLQLFLVTLFPTAVQATPRDELLRFVPRSAGFCVVLQDLRKHVDALLASPFAAQLRDSRLGQTLREGDELRSLARLGKQVEAILGLSVEQIHQQVLGDAVVFVFRPGPPDRPEEEQGLLMIRAGSAVALKTLLERINQLQKTTGELVEIEEREHRGIRYHRRVERRKEGFFHLRGAILLVTSQEEILKDALDAEAEAAPEASPPVAESLKDLGAQEAVLAFWINPRAFDEGIEARLQKVKEEEKDREGSPQKAAALTLFRQCWKALDSAALAIKVDAEATLSLSVKGRSDDLPAPIRDLLGSITTPLPLWQAAQKRTLLAVGSQVSFPALLETLELFLPAPARQDLRRTLERTAGAALGRNVVGEVLPALGPGWMVWLASPPGGEKTWLPEAFFALQIRPGDPEVPLDRAILDAIHSFAMLGVVSYNQQHPTQLMRWKQVRLAGHDIRHLEGDRLAPLGVQPAVTLHDGYLLVASSPAALVRLVQTVKALPGKKPSSPGAVLARVSVDGWRSYLEERRDRLAEVVAASHRLTVPEAGQRLEQLRHGLELLQSLQLTAFTAPGRATLQLSLRPSSPLR